MEDNNYTLEQMRADYQALKSALDNQAIINDKLLRETMRSKVSSIRGKATISIVCGVLVMLMAPVVFHYNPVVHASWWFVVATELLMAFCIFLDWKFNHKVQSTDIASCDLLTFCKDVKQLKQSYKGWIKYGLALGTIWVLWLIYEIWSSSTEPKLAMAMVVGLLFGFAVGALVGWRVDRKIIGTCDEIISNIEDK